MVTIREFEPTDADEVRRLFSEGQSQFAAGFEEDFEAYTRESLKADLSDIQGHYMDRPGSCFWVATVKGSVVGMVGIQRRDSHTGELRRMGVDINLAEAGHCPDDYWKPPRSIAGSRVIPESASPP